LSFDQICEVAAVEREKLCSIDGKLHDYRVLFLKFSPAS